MRVGFLVLLIVACGQRAEKAAPVRAASAAQPRAAQRAATASPASAIVLTTAAGERVVEVAPQGSDLTVTYAGGVLHGRAKGEKRKYTGADGAVAVEVKFGDEGGFKVRTPDGKLLWKVKVTADKIKISDNEENKNPYELKIKEAKVKVYAPGERLLGEVKARTDRVEVEDAAGAEKFRAAGTRAEAYYGVALLDGVPARERAVIMAELAAKH